MHKIIGFFFSKKATFLVALAFLCSTGVDIRAQAGFQYEYGNHCPEEGFFGATVVQQCPDEGYIYVGYTESTDMEDCKTRDVYVVRTDNFGAVTTATVSWEKTYDIAGLGGQDTPHGMIEVSDGSGFVIVGTTDLANPQGDLDIFLMKIDCDGNNLWTTTYGRLDRYEHGYDVFEARTGDLITTSPGDFIIAGSVTDSSLGSSGVDGYILRVSAAGALIWERRYTQWPNRREVEERFFSLTDVEPTLALGGGFQATGDIIAVGEADIPGQGTKDGYVVRVDGANGTITPTAPLMQGAATFGGCLFYQQQFICDAEKLLSVVELQNPGERWLYPHVVIAGYTNSGLGKEIYLIKLFNGNPAASLEMLVGDGQAGMQWDRAKSIREVRHTPAGFGVSIQQWDLVLTGDLWSYTPPPPGLPNLTDAILLGINPTLLAPTGTLGMRYGSAGDHEEGWSLDFAPGSPTRPEGIFVGGNIIHYGQGQGPTDANLYIFKTDPFGSTLPANCEEQYNPTASDPNWQPQPVTPVVTPNNPIETPYVDEDIDHDWGNELCNPAAKKTAGRYRASAPARRAATLRIYPQPIAAGELITLEYMPLNADDVEITFSNAVGARVYNAKLDVKAGVNGRFSISTAGWLAGAYVVEIRDGNHSITSSLILTH